MNILMMIPACRRCTVLFFLEMDMRQSIPHINDESCWQGAMGLAVE
jgi:hypothetical protein